MCVCVCVCVCVGVGVGVGVGGCVWVCVGVCPTSLAHLQLESLGVFFHFLKILIFGPWDSVLDPKWADYLRGTLRKA